MDENRGMLFLYETVLNGAVKDYYNACRGKNQTGKDEMEKWFRETTWVGVFCGLKGIDVEALLEKTEELASRK